MSFCSWLHAFFSICESKERHWYLKSVVTSCWLHVLIIINTYPVVLWFYSHCLTFAGIAICWMIWHPIYWRLIVQLMRNCSSIFSYVDVKHISRRGSVFSGCICQFPKCPCSSYFHLGWVSCQMNIINGFYTQVFKTLQHLKRNGWWPTEYWQSRGWGLGGDQAWGFLLQLFLYVYRIKVRWKFSSLQKRSLHIICWTCLWWEILLILNPRAG